MSLESADFVSGLDQSNPVVGDLASQGDDHLRLLKAVLKATFPGATKAFRFPNSAAEAATTVNVSFPDDQNKLFPVSASGAARTVNLPDPTAGSTVHEDGFDLMVIKTDSSVNAVTIDGNGSQTINGALTLSLTTQWSFAYLIWAGTDNEWYALVGNMNALTTLLINAATELEDPAVADELPIYDASTTTNKKITLTNFFKVIALLTELTGTGAVAIDDLMLISDTNASAAAKRVTIQTLFDALNQLTAETTLDLTADYLMFYDASANLTRKLLLGAFIPARNYAEYTSSASLSGSIPIDNSIPQSNEGDQLASAAITLKKATNRVRVRFTGNLHFTSDSQQIVVALFNDQSANSINASVQVPGDQVGEVAMDEMVAMEVEHAPGSVGPLTYQVRSGSSSGTYSWNSAGLSTCQRATLVIEEVIV